MSSDTKCRKEYMREYSKRYREENREKIREVHREYKKQHYQKNKEKYRTYNRNYRALKREAEGSHTNKDIQRLLKSQDYECPVCFTDITDNFHVDHFIPLSLGGSNSVHNIHLLCPSCNLSKNAYHPHVWLKNIQT